MNGICQYQTDPDASSKKYQRKLRMNSYGTCDTGGHWKGNRIQNSDPGPICDKPHSAYSR